MEGEDADATLCHIALHEFHKLPSEIMKLSRREKAFLYASIGIKADGRKKELAKIRKNK